VTARPVSGRVVDAGGAPVAGARVTIVESPSPMPELALLADGEGHFSLHLPLGRFVLRADGDEGEWGTAEFDPAAASEVKIVIAPLARRQRRED